MWNYTLGNSLISISAWPISAPESNVRSPHSLSSQDCSCRSCSPYLINYNTLGGIFHYTVHHNFVSRSHVPLPPCKVCESLCDPEPQVRVYISTFKFDQTLSRVITYYNHFSNSLVIHDPKTKGNNVKSVFWNWRKNHLQSRRISRRGKRGWFKTIKPLIFIFI